MHHLDLPPLTEPGPEDLCGKSEGQCGRGSTWSTQEQRWKNLQTIFLEVRDAAVGDLAAPLWQSQVRCELVIRNVEPRQGIPALRADLQLNRGVWFSSV